VAGFRRGKGVSQAQSNNRWSEGLSSLVAMYASRFRNFAFASRNHLGSAEKKAGNQAPRATLRREVHPAQEVLEARAGVREIEPEGLPPS